MLRTNYAEYTVNDFVMDEYFQQWVLVPDNQDVHSFWELWLAQHPEKQSAAEEARNLILGLKFNTYTLEKAELNRVWAHISRESLPAQKLRNTAAPVRAIVTWNYSQRIAAALVLLLLATASLYFLLNKVNGYQRYTTAYGEIKNITLPDRSRVVLNANSTLSVPSKWDHNEPREVQLEGEAYFSVVHTRNHQKFIVRTDDGLEVEVLGTEFNVANRSSKTTVVLNSGKVRLHLPESAKSPQQENSLIMKPGELVELEENTSAYTKRVVNTEVYSAWIDQKLILDQTSLREIAAMLKDNYGITVKVTDPLLWDQTVSGSMPLEDTEKLLAQISRTFRLKMTRNGNTVTFEEKP